MAAAVRSHAARDIAVPRGDDGAVARAAGGDGVSLHDRAEGISAERRPGPPESEHRGDAGARIP